MARIQNDSGGIMTKNEALRVALEALKAMQMYAAAEKKGLKICDEAIAVLHQALAQQKLSDSIRPKGKSIVKVWVDEINQALEQTDHGFDRTASHMAGEYVDTAQQEPVARVNRDGFLVETGFGLLEGTLLYTAQPKREWVNLTDEEIAQAVGSPLDEVYLSDFYKVIAKLKEKNT